MSFLYDSRLLCMNLLFLLSAKYFHSPEANLSFCGVNFCYKFFIVLFYFFVSNRVTAMCTTYGTKMTGIARYARMLYAFWISVSRPETVR